jgi:hypothetical protein
MLNNLGDGSTLSLDFTTGILDSRLTFTRSTNATFINSSGYVQFANANLMTYSNPRQTGTAWLTSGTVTWGSSTLTDPTGGSAAQSITFGTTTGAIYNTIGTTVASGITHTFSVWMRSATGTTTVRIGDANVAPVATVTLTTTWQRFSCQYTTSGTNDGGAIFSQTGTPSAEFYVWGAQVQPGSIVGELIQTSGTINTNTPRFDYDPTTTPPTPRGLLIEGSASNLWTYSQDQSQWAVNNVTVNTGTQATAPDGATSLFPVLTNNTGSVQYFVRQRLADTISATSGQTYTYSMFVKKGTHRYVQMFASAIAIFTTPAQANFDLDDGTTGNVANCTTNAVSYSNGWWRLSITVTANQNASQAQPFLMYLVSSKTAARSEVHSLTSASVYAWGAQVEAGSGASSYIPTGASTGFRAADSCVMTGTNFSSWYQSATAGTVYCEFDNPRASLGAAFTPAPVNLGDYSAGNLLSGFIGGYTTGQLFACAIWGNGGNGFQSATVPTVTSIALGNKSAYAFSGQSIMGAFRGSSSSTATTTGTVNAKTVMYVGLNFAPPNNRDFLNSCIQRIKFFPTQYTAAQLQALTT